MGQSTTPPDARAILDLAGPPQADGTRLRTNIDETALRASQVQRTPPPGMVSVPAGSFDMGDPWSEGDSDERPVHTVSLSAYQIGRYEVTNAEYAAFLNSASVSVTSGLVYLNGTVLCDTTTSSSYSQIVYSGGIFSVRTRDGYPMNDHPLVRVSWYGAAAHCNWLSSQQGYQEVYTESGNWPSDLSRNGYHLPTEAQWERAAAWEPGHGHWRYGFTSDTISTSQANYNSANPLGLTSYPYTSPVGHYSGSTSDVGCYDMSGNVWEWCNDWYSSTYYSVSPSSDPEGPSPQTYRVLRGGGWIIDVYLCRSADRVWDYPNSRNNYNGFRVSRTP